MVIVRLVRGGSRNRPYFYIRVAESRFNPKKRFIENMGFYNPFAKDKGQVFKINIERLTYWIKCGAQLSPTVKQLHKKYTTLNAADINTTLNNLNNVVAAPLTA